MPSLELPTLTVPSSQPDPAIRAGAIRALRFAAGLVMLHLVATWAYVGVIGGKHKATRSDFLWEIAPDRVDLVFLGDSHPRSAIDPKLFEHATAVNLATGGEHYAKAYYRFKTLYDRADRSVGAIVVPLDATSFTSWHADNYSPEYVWGQYVDFFDLGAAQGDRFAYVGPWLKATFFPYAGELRTFAQLRGKRFGFGEALASGRFDLLGQNGREHAAREQAEAHFKGADLMDDHQILGLERQIEWAKREGIRVVAISYPLTDAYLRVLETELGDPRAVVTREAIGPLRERHPEVVHLDCTDLYRGQPDLFADPHHLNRRGRVLFTAEVERRLIEAGVLDAG